MTDLKDYLTEMICINPDSPKANASSIVAFLEDNDWFGTPPEMIDGRFVLTDYQRAVYTQPITTYLSAEQPIATLLNWLTQRYPITAKYWKQFSAEQDLSESVIFYVTDFFLFQLKKDLPLYSDPEIVALGQQAVHDLTLACGRTLVFFLAWLRGKTRTNYHNDHTMPHRYTMDVQNEAYSMDEYLQLLYYLYNEDYIAENDMYAKAAKSKNYTDTWLYLSLPYICALRYTDMQDICHPVLMYPPEEVIQQISEGTFLDSDARLVLLSVTVRMAALSMTPRKTRRFAGIIPVKFCVPTSCEVHIGKLLALAEAHRQLAGTPDEPIVRKISTHKEITRYMGDEIGSLFFENDFRLRSATKSYLQAIFLLSDDILGDHESTMKGYILAAMARGHKSGYESFAATTIEYLKDMQLGNYTPEYVVFELLERGVLSFIPGYLLKMLRREDYGQMDVSSQTKLLQTFGLHAYEVDATVSTVDRSLRQAQQAVAQAVSSGVDIRTILHRIATGEAFSKEMECLCLVSACGKQCPYSTKRQCVGCHYEISTKSTLFLLLEELKRMQGLLDTAADPLETAKYTRLIQQVVLPQLDEILCCLKQDYGEEVFKSYEEMIEKIWKELSTIA